MPRSATDATRFTSTTPHASAKPIPAVSLDKAARKGKVGNAGKGPVGETPLEKVRRLRAAADAAKAGQISTLDKFLVRGRVWADTAHRITTLTLIGATVIAGGVTVYALGDMMIYNRRKKREFFAHLEEVKASAVITAREAIAHDNATPEQIEFIKREEEHDAWLEAKKNKNGIFKRSTAWLFSGLRKEEEGEDIGSSERRLGYEGLSEDDDVLGERESDIVRAIEEKKLEATSKVKETVKQAFEDERQRQRTGGPLDRIGAVGQEEPEVSLIEKTDSSSETLSKGSGGWWSWVTGR